MRLQVSGDSSRNCDLGVKDQGLALDFWFMLGLLTLEFGDTTTPKDLSFYVFIARGLRNRNQSCLISDFDESDLQLFLVARFVAFSSRCSF